MTEGLPEPLCALLSARAYPHPVENVELIETHISWVLLAGRFAYKIKRPVCYPFVDLRARDRRQFLCEEELRLNRRFAPQLYLDVCRIVAVDGEARINANGPVLEHAVRMRRFERADELDRLLDSWRIAPGELEAFGRALAVLHARFPSAEQASPWGQAANIRARTLRNLEECAEASAVFGATESVAALRQLLEEKLTEAQPWMTVRRAGGRIRECHGDLHCRNVVRIDSRLVAFDCLEFDPALRWIDVADEIALLSSDLLARRRPVRAHAFLSGYLAESADYQACRILKLYQAHRALVRTKVAALTAAALPGGAERTSLRGEHDRLLACAGGFLGRSAIRPKLVVMSGLSGSGKTWLAHQLAPRLAAMHLRSDLERKRRAGLAPLDSSHSNVGEGLYTPNQTDAVYANLAEAAEHVLCGGFTVIVDATFLRRAQRAQFLALAHRLNVPLRLVLCEAPTSVLRARLRTRAQDRGDASEANWSVLDWQIAHLENLSVEEEDIEAIRVDSAQADAVERILQRTRDPS